MNLNFYIQLKRGSSNLKTKTLDVCVDSLDVSNLSGLRGGREREREREKDHLRPGVMGGGYYY